MRPAASRVATELGWLRSWHSFSFGRHYDPANTHFGLLLVSNDDVVAPGTGFDAHPHRDMEIVTWVLEGSLVHQDSAGHRGLVYPGLAQRMSAGSGILHSEKNDAGPPSVAPDAPSRDGRRVHFLQMWVVPDERGGRPGYEQLDVSAELAGGGWVPVASGRPREAAAIRIRQRDATLHAARLPAGAQVRLPEAPYAHLFVARGEVALEGAGRLGAGDAVRVTGATGQGVTAVTPAELLLWEMHATLPLPPS